jgi:hypothetical protein
MDAPLDAESLRDTLNRVIAYRDLQRGVRASAKHNLFWGGLFFVVWYLNFGGRINPQNIFSVTMLGIAVLELGVGLLKYLAPSAECLLLDAAVFFAFTGLNLFRAAVIWNAGRQPDVVAIGLGLYMGYNGVVCVQGYGRLRRAFAQRPSGQHIAYVNALLREIRAADPEVEPDAVRFGGLRGKLIGDMLVVADPAGGAFVADRDAVELRRATGPDGEPVGGLRLYGQPQPEFPLDDGTWRNYARWKGVPA